MGFADRATGRQLAFWRELLAPFAPHEIESANGYEYVDKRVLSNRLDSVCGPDGWDVEYRPTARGYTCRIGIACPDESGNYLWRYKEDGGGFSGMGQYKTKWNPDTRQKEKTDEWETDANNDEKSAYTNAFRRAAQDCWGIGRYLYKQGIPTFLDPDAQAAPAREFTQEQASPPSGVNPDRRVEQQASQQNSQAPSKLNLPGTGPAVFAWAKEQERTFSTEIIKGMGREGEKQGWGSTFKDWSQPQVNTICLGAIKSIRELPAYKGQYEHLFPGGAPDPKIQQQKGSGPQTTQPAPGVNVADLRKKLLDATKALLSKQQGKPVAEVPVEDVRSAFKVIAAAAANSQGQTGEVPESLSGMSDVVWLNNCIAIAHAEIENAQSAPVDDIPF